MQHQVARRRLGSGHQPWRARPGRHSARAFPRRRAGLHEPGHGISRLAVMHNDFVLVGPPADPAKTASTGGIELALKAIARTRSPFASRADESGTNAEELKLWQP